MARRASGTYRTTTTAGEKVRAFVPAPLPPEPVILLDPPRQKRLEQATVALGRLDGISVLLPDPHLFLYSYVRREAVLSSQIEGTQSSLSDLLLFELEDAPGAPFDDVVEVSNYVAALQHGMARLRGGFPLSNRLLREIHGRLMQSGRGSEKSPGEYRTSQNWIGGTRPGNAHYVPPPPHEVGACMAALERFLHDDQTPVLVKAALVHVQFESIHPFLDGNGRLGRLLIALVLQQGGLLGEPLLYLSLHFKQHRRLYYDLLDRVRSDGDWEAWLDFFLDGVADTATSAVTTAHRLVALFEADNRRVAQSGRGAARALQVLTALRTRPVLSIGRLRDSHGMTFPTASKAMDSLIELGIAKELTGKARNRVFSYAAYLAALQEGGEPL
jgi:Fic family protein